ncbi:IS630 family transposase [Streptomyces sp. SudanB182_2057]|uniref:IS630 family transposase n=1 Tax=Streptomyces sp. SudanB182_2057 TaxID=3035281 RepID=UPI003F57F6B0
MIAKLVQADEDTVRDVIHRFNEIGLACLDPRWAGGRPRLLSTDDEDFVVQTAITRPTKLGQPFTRWSIRKLAAYLCRVHGRVIRISREALRCLLTRRGITFQRTKTWKESPDPERDAKLDRIEHVLERSRIACSRSTSSGRLASGPPPARAGLLPVTPNGILRPTTAPTGLRYFYGCYSLDDDRLWGVARRKKGATNTLAALKSIRTARPDGAPIYAILDNLFAHKGETIWLWSRKNRVELCFTPTYASWANRVEAHLGALRQFTLANSDHRSHPAQTRALYAYLRWRNANARHSDVLAARRKERARIRSEKGIRWGGRPLTATA